MTTEDGELLSALIDREPVDPAALARVLEDPDGRRALVEFASMRRVLQAPAPGEAEWLAAPARLATRPRVVHPRWRLVAAAAVLVATTGLGMVAERYRGRERPPEPTRIVQFDPLVTTASPR